MPVRINLNADLGESFGAWTMGHDEAILGAVDSANVACGFHAGDPLVMRRTVALAKARGVSIGAHPGFPDLQGFGRRRMELSPAEIEAMLIYQVGALRAIARAEGAEVTHVKPHGALNNMAAAERPVADAIARALAAYDPTLTLLAPALSQLAAAGREHGLPVVEEVFADRAYQDDGQLVPRGQPGAMIHGAAASLVHVRRMVDGGAIVALSGKRLPVEVQSICVHGDGPEAAETALLLRQGLAQAGYELVTLPALV
jgi:5-oxoprolinase (ATP-hydrolysing) subunit A